MVVGEWRVSARLRRADGKNAQPVLVTVMVMMRDSYWAHELGLEHMKMTSETRVLARILRISGEWETRGNAMDFQSPRSGGALF